ncbi:MAG: ABC transporter permease [Dehalococcoidia bacterium]|nr:ABC transporter permease [Dehalococcoidia bacterium]
MLSYAAGRLLQAVPVLFIVSLVVFVIIRLVPGDPAELAAGEEAPPAQVEAIREDLGLDRPLAVQYVQWVGAALQGDFGTSYDRGLPVRRLIAIALPPTVELAAIAYPLALAIGVPLGAVAGLRPGSRVDVVVSAVTVVAVAVPGFVLASVLLWVFAVQLGWLPASGRVPVLESPVRGLESAVLPAVSLAVAMAAVLARFTRTAVAQVCRQDYVRTARAKGLAERTVLWRHALRNALVPVITVASLQVGQLLGGAVIVEQVFTRPGMGRLMVNAIQVRDYAVVQGGLLVLVVAFVVVNLAADIACGLADPAVRQA